MGGQWNQPEPVLPPGEVTAQVHLAQQKLRPTSASRALSSRSGSPRRTGFQTALVMISRARAHREHIIDTRKWYSVIPASTAAASQDTRSVCASGRWRTAGGICQIRISAAAEIHQDRSRVHGYSRIVVSRAEQRETGYSPSLPLFVRLPGCCRLGSTHHRRSVPANWHRGYRILPRGDPVSRRYSLFVRTRVRERTSMEVIGADRDAAPHGGSGAPH